MNKTTLTIGRRTFAVEIMERDTDEGRCVYQLTGVRGAQYFTMRNKQNPDAMFLVSTRRSLQVDPLGPLWLTDKNGTLEVAG